MSEGREDGGRGGAAPEAEGGTGALEPLEGFEFVIERDGTVTFVDFPPELVEIAYALNPDDPLVCERRALLAGADEADEPEGG